MRYTIRRNQAPDREGQYEPTPDEIETARNILAAVAEQPCPDCLPDGAVYVVGPGSYWVELLHEDSCPWFNGVTA
jgi:hypothetical protein